MEKGNETYLSEWLAGCKSDEELKQLISEQDFVAYQKLKNALDTLTIASPDLNKNFAAIQQKKSLKKKNKRIKLWSFSAVAASLLLFVALYQFFYFSNTINTTFSDTKTVALPDHSIVTLNAKSSIAYPNLFKWNRSLTLEGEAYFAVQKGSAFSVETALGKVTVLGTKFNVLSRKDFFEITCYEGKVRVQSKNKVTIVTPTECVRFYANTYENWAEVGTPKPTWLAGESSFKNVPMLYVLDCFEKQYNVKVKYPENIKNIKFTGAFTNSNEETALQSICIPLHLKVTKNLASEISIFNSFIMQPYSSNMVSKKGG
jgi:ferric-dicitrate binding protein FerR (iron transport regulator)